MKRPNSLKLSTKPDVIWCAQARIWYALYTRRDRAWHYCQLTMMVRHRCKTWTTSRWNHIPLWNFHSLTSPFAAVASFLHADFTVIQGVELLFVWASIGPDMLSRMGKCRDEQMVVKIWGFGESVISARIGAFGVKNINAKDATGNPMGTWARDPSLRSQNSTSGPSPKAH